MQRQGGCPASGTNFGPIVLTDVISDTPEALFLCSNQVIFLCAPSREPCLHCRHDCKS